MITQSRTGVLYVTSYPPRECGIATFTHDLRSAMVRQFHDAFHLPVCALENGSSHVYSSEVDHRLDTGDPSTYLALAARLNDDATVDVVHVQHEFGLFGGTYGAHLLELVESLQKPVVLTFHTVLPGPDVEMRRVVQTLGKRAAAMVVMTDRSRAILADEYDLRANVFVIPHGTHLAPPRDRETLRRNLGLAGRRVLSTFGLLGPGKSIETAIDALPGIVAVYPDALYLVLGKTHPGEVRERGEAYRLSLTARVDRLRMANHVRFINEYLPTDLLLDYLAASDIYLFTSSDPNQAVSGTFSYALASGCPVVATPIPHVEEVLSREMGRIAPFGDHRAFASAVNELLSDPDRLVAMRATALHHTRATAWENVAIRHSDVYALVAHRPAVQVRSFPPASLTHIDWMTTDIGMLQFSVGGVPDPAFGYTIDDNSRAAIATCLHYELTGDAHDLQLVATYVQFMERCQQPNGRFLNLYDAAGAPHPDNGLVNLDDANGRAIWALGVILAHRDDLPVAIAQKARTMMHATWPWLADLRSPRAVAYAIKGLAAQFAHDPSERLGAPIRLFADQLAAWYDCASTPDWRWFEDTLTYANALLPDAMLCAFAVTGEPRYRTIAIESLDFLMAQTFAGRRMRPISNDGWFHRGTPRNFYGQQSIDVATMVEALACFAQVLDDAKYLDAAYDAMSWYYGNNDLGQIMYDPASGGCYDGLEEHNVSINQGAESTVCYVIARLMMEELAQLELHPLSPPRRSSHPAGVS